MRHVATNTSEARRKAEHHAGILDAVEQRLDIPTLSKATSEPRWWHSGAKVAPGARGEELE